MATKSCVRLDTPPPKAHVQKTLFHISHGLKDFFKIRCFVCFPLLATGFNIASSKTIQMWQSTWQRVDRIRLHNCSEPHQLNSWGPAGTLIASLSDAGEKKKRYRPSKTESEASFSLAMNPHDRLQGLVVCSCFAITYSGHMSLRASPMDLAG